MNSQCAENIFKCISSMDDNGSCNQCINKAKSSNECLDVDNSQFPTDGNCLPRDMENSLDLENTRRIIEKNYCNIREAMISSSPEKCRNFIMEQFKNSKCNAYQLGSIFNNSPNLCGSIPTPKPPSCKGCTREGGSCLKQNCCCPGLECFKSGDGTHDGTIIAQCAKIQN